MYSVADGVGACGTGTVFDDTSAQCQPDVTIPAGTPAGTWTVSKLELWDNAGNHATYKDLNALPVIVTSNAVVQATGFAANPTQVNNWVQSATAEVSMDVSGARDGLSAIYVDFAAGSPCTDPSATPTLNADGTYSVSISMFSFASSCTVAGLAVLTAQGTSLYTGLSTREPTLGLRSLGCLTPPRRSPPAPR